MKDVIKMPNYQKLYFHLMHETEKALQLLAQAQRDCEEQYLLQSKAESAENQETPV